MIVTSSSDEKPERTQALGAQLRINYRRVPEWAAELRRLSGGRGADAVIEFGGVQTLTRSIRCPAPRPSSSWTGW